MSRPYFRQVPNFNYVSRGKNKYISEYTQVKNLFKRGKLREDIFGNLSFFEKYSIIGDERPDNVASKFYGDSSLDWVILLSNNILNIQSEWPLTQKTFDKVMLEKYKSYENLYSGIHHYETKEIKNSLGITILKEGITINSSWRTNGNFISFENIKIFDIYSGNGSVPSTTVTVEVLQGVYNLKQGDRIIIENISESIYNGIFTVSDILISDESSVYLFTYELPEIPNKAKPTLAIPRVETIGTITSEISEIVGNSYYYEYYDYGLEKTILLPSTSVISPITNYDYEIKLEEKKRNIYILKPIYLNIVFNDMDDIMPYKKGGNQYIDATLKQGDNIRLYE